MFKRCCCSVQKRMSFFAIMCLFLVCTPPLSAKYNDIKVYPFRKTINFASGNLLGQRKTNFQMTFIGVSQEGHKDSFRKYSYEHARSGCKFVTIHYDIKNLGLRRSPSFSSVELETLNGYLYKMDEWKSGTGFFYKFPQGESSECYMLFEIPISQKPVSLSFRAGGKNYKVALPSNIPVIPDKIRSTIYNSDDEAIQIIDHYLSKKENNRLFLSYKNISRNYLHVYSRLEFLDDRIKSHCRLDLQENMPPGTEASFVYDFNVYPDPMEINNYTISLYSRTGPMGENTWGRWPSWQPDYCAEAEILETNFYEPSTIRKTNLSLDELGLLGENILAVLAIERKNGRIDAATESWAALVAMDIVNVAHVYDSESPVLEKMIEKVYMKFRPKLFELYTAKVDGYPVRVIPPIDTIDVTVDDAMADFRGLLFDFVFEGLKATHSLSSPLSKLADFATRQMLKLYMEFKLKGLGFLEIDHPVVGKMQVVYRKEEQLAFAILNLKEIQKNNRIVSQQQQVTIVIPLLEEPSEIEYNNCEFKPWIYVAQTGNENK